MIWWYVGYIVIALVLAGVVTKDWNNGRTVTIDVLTSLCWPLIIVMGCVWMFVSVVSETKRVVLGWFNKGETE